MVNLETDEPLLASSRAQILSLWVDLKTEEITRSELNSKMGDLLDDLEANHPEIYKQLETEVHFLRRQVLSDEELKTYK